MLVCYSIPPPSIPALRHSSGITYYSPINSSTSKSAAAATAIFFAPSKSRPACYNHRQDTLTPGLRVDRSQSSRIGRVAIYCATVFCLLMMYLPIPSKPASTITSSKGGYYQLPPPQLRGCLPVSRHATLCWKLPRARSILGG